MDPFGLHRQWSSVLEGAQKPSGGGPAETASSQEFWRQWTEATTDLWRRTAAYGTFLVGFTPQWTEMVGEVWRQMLDGGKLPADPLDFYLRLYNATNGPLSKMIKDVLKNELFLEDQRRFFENYASLEAVFQRAAERYFGDNLQLSTRSDSSRVAALVVGMEDKVDRLEEAFEEFEYGYAKPATAETVSALEERIGGLEQKLDDNRSDLARVEEKLDRLFAALDTAANGDARTKDASRRAAGTAGDAGEKGE